MDEPIEKITWFSKLPKWIRAVLLAVSILTVVYWVFFITYKLLCGLRKFGAFIFDNRNYWTFIFCLCILALGSLIVAQFILGLNPFGKFGNWLVNIFTDIRNYISKSIAK